MDPEYICRSVGFLFDFLWSVGPAVLLAGLAWSAGR